MITTIDLGSNSFRVLQYDCATHTIINQFETVVGTADGLAQTGVISKDAVTRIVQAINKAKQILCFDPSTAIAVTTEAMRSAANAKKVLFSIKEQTDINFKIIDSNEEASLSLLAMQYALKREKIENNRFILIDIGGGSTEIIISSPTKTFSKSFSLGIVTLTQSTNKDKQFKIFCKDIQKFKDQTSLELSNFSLIATAGIPTTIAALKHGLNYEIYDSKIINGTIVTLNDLSFYKNMLQQTDPKQANKLVGTGRIDFIESGIDIFSMLYTIFNKQESMVFDDGLREGVAIDHCLNS